MMTKSSKNNPLKSLLATPRKVTPATLTGEDLQLWRQLVKSYCNGELDGISHLIIHNWCREHLNINCGRETVRRALTEARRQSQ